MSKLSDTTTGLIEHKCLNLKVGKTFHFSPQCLKTLPWVLRTKLYRDKSISSCTGQFNNISTVLTLLTYNIAVILPSSCYHLIYLSHFSRVCSASIGQLCYNCGSIGLWRCRSIKPATGYHSCLL